MAFDWVRRLLGKSVVKDAQEGRYGWEAVGTGDAAKPSVGWDDLSDSDREQAARKVSLIYDCISYVATTAAEAPLIVTQSDAGSEVIEVENAPILELLKQPNSYYSARMLIQFIVWRLMCTGEYYIWKWRNGYREIGELWPIPSSWVKVKTGKGNVLVDHYTIKQDRGKELPVPSLDMVRQWMPDPASTWKALGPLHGADRDYQTEKERGNLVGDLLRNMNVPGLTISTPAGLSPDQKRDLRRAIIGRFGTGGRGRHLLLEGGATADLLNPFKDLDTAGLMAMTEPRICGAFGIPPVLVGARTGLEHSTYSNYEQARKAFYLDTMRPLWMALSDGLTKGLLQDEGTEGQRLGFDLREMPELQEDLKDETERAVAQFKGGLAQRNEARRIAGLKELDGVDGEMFLLPANAFERRVGEEEVEL